MRYLSLLLLPLLLGATATVHLGHTTAPRADEDPSYGYRYAPVCRDANLDGACDTFPAQMWTAGVTNTTLQATTVCNAGDDAKADPDVHPTYSATGLAAGVSINSSTGEITVAPTTKGSMNAIITCANDLGSMTVALDANIDPSPTTQAAGYFVRNTGSPTCSDSTHTGLSDAEAWCTLSKVNSTVTTPGADVFLYEGDDFSGETLTVDWGGTAADPATINTYHLVTGVETAGYLTTRAKITGTYDATCSKSLGASTQTCNFNNGSAVPANQYSALVTITSNYVTLKNLEIGESAGIGVVVDGYHHFTLDNVHINITAMMGLYPRNAPYLTVINSEIERTGAASARGDQLISGGPHAISYQYTIPSYGLIENTYFHELFGEGINCRTSSFCIIRGNRFANFKNVAVYIDNQSDSVVENNEIYGKTTTSIAPGGGWNASGYGIGVAVEQTSSPNYSAVRNVIRNNLIANVTNCLNINVFPLREAAGWQTGGQFLGNTCLAFTGQAVNLNDPAANIDSWEIANNIFDQPNNGGGSLCSITGGTGKVSIHHNSWPSTPSDSDCRSIKDVVGPSGVSTTFDWTTAGQGHYPSAADWVPASGGLARGAGEAMTDPTYHTAAEFLQFDSFVGNQVGGGTCNPSSTDWQKELIVDFDCTARVLDIGAKQH